MLARFVVRWPASINLVLAAGILAATLAPCLIARRRGLFLQFKWRVFVVVLLPLIAGALLVWYVGLSIRGGRVDNPLPALAAYWVLALLVVFASSRYTPNTRAGFSRDFRSEILISEIKAPTTRRIDRFTDLQIPTAELCRARPELDSAGHFSDG